jgi:hypothetical protein
MKTFEEDNKLKSLLKNVKLNSPDPNFTVRVMNRIFQENSILERLKNERILGKGFWIILCLFVAIIFAIIIFSGTTGDESIINQVLPDLNTSNAKQEYENFFQQLGTVPLSIAGILSASSILLFIDWFFNLKFENSTK